MKKKKQNAFGSVTEHRDGSLSVTATSEQWERLWAVVRQGRMFFDNGQRTDHSATCLEFMSLIDGNADIWKALGPDKAHELEKACRNLIRQAYDPSGEFKK